MEHDEAEGSIHQLRVLIANERQDRLAVLADVIEGIGHEVVARETHVAKVGPATARVRPDVAIVGLGISAEHALDMISKIVREAFCPVIAITHTHDPAWVSAAAERGVYAYITDEHTDELQSAIDVTLRRFAEYHDLHGAFETRYAEAERALEYSRRRQRDALELHDGVVQGLAVAHLALQLDHADDSRAELEKTLAQAKAIVARAVDELKANGISQDQLLSDTTGRGRDD
ncbi:MAG: hypothetical protein H0X39_07735 [Actinobacteria bacterium]|nr:hypothetical protein [Actinomycetota bacterium]